MDSLAQLLLILLALVLVPAFLCALGIRLTQAAVRLACRSA